MLYPLEHPLEERGRSNRSIDPCLLVIFGATGDLTGRKLMPALYNLGREGQLSPSFACVGFARRRVTNESFREEIKKDINEFSRVKPIEEISWKNLSEKLFYHTSNFDEDQGYERLRNFLNELDTKLGTKGNRIYYLSVQPKFFPLIIKMLAKHSLLYDSKNIKDKWSRVIIEKPFGKDLSSANALQNDIQKFLYEDQIYRIDHYLGKETVQNLLVFRFANSIFEALWNYRHIDHVQITVAEDIGIGTRGHFFEEEGLIRDVVQNHMMQLLTLVAMEPPINLTADAIRDEKVKVLESIRPLSQHDLEQSVIRGQYGKGVIGGENVVAYRSEKDVNPQSKIDTYIALKLYIDNWRWANVPFYLRSGKRLPKRVTEIAIIFKEAPGILFKNEGRANEANVLAIRIQPDEGIAMKVNCKVPGPTSPIQPVKMDFRYGSYFGKAPPDAYERLIWECVMGDSTLFARTDEVLLSWRFFTPILDYWAAKNPLLATYEAGSWGPKEAEEWMQREGRSWRRP